MTSMMIIVFALLLVNSYGFNRYVIITINNQ